MWYIMNISAQGDEVTLLTTRYRNIARFCAIFLPGKNVCRFVSDHYNANENKSFAFDEFMDESA